MNELRVFCKRVEIGDLGELGFDLSLTGFGDEDAGDFRGLTRLDASFAREEAGRLQLYASSLPAPARASPSRRR